jgi:hypothetical protein
VVDLLQRIEEVVSNVHLDQKDHAETSKHHKGQQMVTNNGQDWFFERFEIFRGALTRVMVYPRFLEALHLLPNVHGYVVELALMNRDDFAQTSKRRLNVELEQIVDVLVRELGHYLEDVRFTVVRFDVVAGSENGEQEKYEQTAHVQVEDELFSVAHEFLLVRLNEVLAFVVVYDLVVNHAEIAHELRYFSPA